MSALTPAIIEEWRKEMQQGHFPSSKLYQQADALCDAALRDCTASATGATSYLPGLRHAATLLRSNGFEKSAIAIEFQIRTLEANPAADRPEARPSFKRPIEWVPMTGAEFLADPAKAFAYHKEGKGVNVNNGGMLMYPGTIADYGNDE